VKRTWKVGRTLVQRSDAQRRWDIAYQRLLQWTNEVSGVPAEGTRLNTTQEVKDESCHLRPCLDFTATTNPNH
jgi:hypothetical protein